MGGMTPRRLWRRLRAVWDRPVAARADLATLVMGYIATVTAGTGLFYLLPTDTFALSPSFAWMAAHGGEGFWGWLIWSLGLLALVATWLEWLVARIEREHLSGLAHRRVPSRIFGRYVWLAVALLWVFIGASFALTVPFSPGTVSYVCLGVLSQIVASTARHRREAGSLEGGGAG